MVISSRLIFLLTLVSSLEALFEPLKIFPGTNFCGAGNIATNPENLGIFPGVDFCCRAHDFCPLKLSKFGLAFGLFNPRPFPAMHCGCDESFRNCLKSEGSDKARMVGQFYFDHLESPCFILKKGKSCTRRTWFGKCLETKTVKSIGEWRKPKSFSL